MSSFSTETNRGTRHENNEDSIGYDCDSGVWLIADGMGGHAAGEIASRIARDTFLALVNDGRRLVEAALAAHAQIVQAAEAQRAHLGMGSTLVAMQIADGHAEFVWVGDSRGYLWRGGRLQGVTNDHSLVQVLIDQGRLTEASARNHPRRNMLTQALGLDEPEPDTRSLPLQTGDWLLLCSDGLNDELTDGEIVEVLDACVDIERVAQRLVARALACGGRDNVSVVAVAYDGPGASGEVAAAGQQGQAAGLSVRQMLGNPTVLSIAAVLLALLLFWIVIRDV